MSNLHYQLLDRQCRCIMFAHVSILPVSWFSFSKVCKTKKNTRYKSSYFTIAKIEYIHLNCSEKRKIHNTKWHRNEAK